MANPRLRLGTFGKDETGALYGTVGGLGLGSTRVIEARELATTDHVIEYNGKRTHSVKQSFSRLCKSLGIEASAHVLRHTAASWMVMDGVPLAEVARMLGDSEKTVETVYGKHSPDYLQRAVSSLSFSKGLPKAQP